MPVEIPHDIVAIFIAHLVVLDELVIEFDLGQPRLRNAELLGEPPLRVSPGHPFSLKMQADELCEAKLAFAHASDCDLHESRWQLTFTSLWITVDNLWTAKKPVSDART